MRRRRANEPPLLPRDEHEAPGQGGLDHRSAGSAAMARLLQGTVFRQATAPVQEEDALGPEMSAAIAAERGRGASLPEPVRADMEHRLGSDFSGVRVHHDRQADTLNHALAAEAFTTGTDIFFSGGSYNPTSSAGRELLAHELTHVAQQAAQREDRSLRGPQSQASDAAGAVSLSPRVSQPGDPAEANARAVARSVAADHLPAGAGNQAVARVLPLTGQASAVVHRQPAEGAPAGPTAVAPAQPDLGSVLSVQAMEYLRVTATQTSLLAGAYAERTLRVVDALRGRLQAVGGRYHDAYEQYAKVIRAARAEANDQKEWKEIILGIAIGTGVGLLSGAIVPEGLAFGYKVLAEVVGESVEAAAAGGAKGLHLTDVAGTELEPGGLDPDVLNTQIWQRLSALYRGGLGVQQQVQYLPLLLGGAEYALGQFRLLQSGGQADMPRSDLIGMATSLNRATGHLAALNTWLRTGLDALSRLEATTKAPVPKQEEIESDIWIMWMSTLSNRDSDILDLDPIEDHLEAIGVIGPGILGVDFGWYTSEDDELAALSAARSQAGRIHARYEALGRQP